MGWSAGRRSSRTGGEGLDCRTLAGIRWLEMLSRRIAWCALLLVGGTALGGCTTVALEPADRAALASASIDPIVAVTSDLDLRDPRFDLVNLWAAVYAAHEGEVRAEETAQRMQQAQIDLGVMAREEFEGALRRAGIGLAGDPTSPSAVFHLDVQQLGLQPGNPYGTSVQPLVDVHATLVDASGRTLWRDRGLVQAAFWTDTPAHEYDEFVANPELLREAFRVAFRLASEDLVASLQEE